MRCTSPPISSRFSCALSCPTSWCMPCRISMSVSIRSSRNAAHDEPTDVIFASGEPDTVQWEDNLGEFETRLLFQQLLGNETEAATLATGWDGDRYQVLGPRSDVLVWYSVWDDAAAAARFTGGLQRAWAKRPPPPGGRAARRSEMKQLTVH